MKKENGNTCCFTGHRPHKLKSYNAIDNLELLSALRKVIIDHIENKGIIKFISGMALGIDMWAANIVLKLKEKYPHIELICAIPCENQWENWIKEEDKNEWHSISSKADKVYYVSNEPYTAWCLQKRNEWMVDNSSCVIAVWDESKGGTYNCIKYAKKNGLKITHLHSKTLKVKELKYDSKY